MLVGRLLPHPPVRTAAGQDVLLDEALGSRFVLLLRSARPVEDFARLRQPVWDRLRAARVALLPAGSPAQAVKEVQAVTEANDALAAAPAGYPDCALLLRPDHYVAAAIPLDCADSAS